jgi:hypothetical protein
MPVRRAGLKSRCSFNITETDFATDEIQHGREQNDTKRCNGQENRPISSTLDITQ